MLFQQARHDQQLKALVLLECICQRKDANILPQKEWGMRPAGCGPVTVMFILKLFSKIKPETHHPVSSPSRSRDLALQIGPRRSASRLAGWPQCVALTEACIKIHRTVLVFSPPSLLHHHIPIHHQITQQTRAPSPFHYSQPLGVAKERCSAFQKTICRSLRAYQVILYVNTVGLRSGPQFPLP
jgi:hypothetical protein